MGIDKAQQLSFCDSVNQGLETSTLFPMAAISAVPQSLIRDVQDADELAKHIGDFFKINMQSIKATKIICDFRTPKVAPFVNKAIEAAMKSPEASIIEEIVIIE